VRSGTVFVLSLHTTTGLTVNEGLPDLEKDIAGCLERLVPEDRPYRHARFLHSDGQMAINAPSHLRGALLGFQVFFPIEEGRMVTGARQTIYFVELDGPQERNYVIQILGE
jgi:secondary thiamine-phosphate synthase enzyme